MGILLKNNLKIKKDLEEVNFLDKLDKKLKTVKIGILNLMPNLEETEKDLLRVLDTPILQVEVEFLYLKDMTQDIKRKEYLEKYYKLWDKEEIFQGIIITGAPLEHLEFLDVSYIKGLEEFLDYTKELVKSTIFICWAAELGLKYFYDINRDIENTKLSGLFKHYVVNETKLVKGFDDYFEIPISRYCKVREEEILLNKDLILTSKANLSGVYIVEAKNKKQVFLTGHAEYGQWTLDKEFLRDKIRGIDIVKPYNYYRFQNEKIKPKLSWKAHQTLLYHNWLYYYVLD